MSMTFIIFIKFFSLLGRLQHNRQRPSKVLVCFFTGPQISQIAERPSIKSRPILEVASDLELEIFIWTFRPPLL